MNKNGNIFVVSAASGTGKTSVIAEVLKNNPEIRLSISHTTRSARDGEQNGVHYYFVDKNKFEQMIGEGAFVEHALVYGNYYGTSVAEIERIRQSGCDVILEIDIQGAEQIRRQIPESIGVFILPPSIETLKQRLVQRNTDSPDAIETRLASARGELEQATLFDYLIVNDDLKTAAEQLSDIIRASRFRQESNKEALISLLK